MDYIRLMLKSEMAQLLWIVSIIIKFEFLGDEQVQEALKQFEKAAQIAGLASIKPF